MIEFLSENIALPDINQNLITRWVNAVADSYNKSLGQLCYVFCDDSYILSINKEYLNHDYYTDIITFDYCDSETISGDLIISLDTVRSNAKQFDAKFENELNRVIIHGVLHLCGLQDKSEDEALDMRRAEDNALLLLNKITDEV